MMIFVLMLACLAANSGVNGQLQAFSQAHLDPFIASFRQTLLSKIAVETKNTLAKSEELKNEIENVCQPKINKTVDACKICAKRECQASPSFNDILQLANPYRYLKGPLDSIGKKLSIAYNLIGDKISPFVKAMSNLGAAIPNEIKKVFEKMNEGIQTMIKVLKLEEIGKFVVDLKNIIPDSFNELGKKFIGIFTGRRRRSLSNIDPKVRKCMGKCNACKPLLHETEAQIVAAVCGEKLATDNATLVAHMQKLKSVYDHIIDEKNPIVVQLRVDRTKMNANFELLAVDITWYINGKAVKYTATKPVPFLDMATPLALEYWNQFPG